MAKFHINLLTLFPDMFPGMLGDGVTGRALEKGIWSLNAVNIRDFATDNYKTVDDTPFGGGAGMVMKPDIIASAIESLPQRGRMIYMSPRGRVLSQKLARELAAEDCLTILCGRYEGVDQRVLDAYGFEEISIGDYVLSGGELAATVLADSCIRLLDGTVGNAETTAHESHENGLLEHPHYTRPAEWPGPDGTKLAVPEVLTSGHHKNIDDWRRAQSEKLTRENRPDMWIKYENNS